MNVESLKTALEGVVAIAITPMTTDLQLDEAGLRSHLRYITGNGITSDNGSIVVGGSTGEAGALTIAERKRVVQIAIDEIGDDLPIIAGCNHTSIVEALDLVQHAQEAGAAGAMILAPYYYRPTDDVVLDFFRLISAETDIGILLYNNLEVTRHDVSVEVLTELASSSKVVGIKECTTDFLKMEQLCRAAGDSMTIVNGHGEFLEPFAALAGTKGFISSTSNFAPQVAVKMWEARSAGEYVKAKEIRDGLTPYLDLARRYASDGGEPRVLSVLKKATDMVGSKGGPGRLPLRPLSDAEVQEVEDMLQQMRLI